MKPTQWYSIFMSFEDFQTKQHNKLIHSLLTFIDINLNGNLDEIALYHNMDNKGNVIFYLSP